MHAGRLRLGLVDGPTSTRLDRLERRQARLAGEVKALRSRDRERLHMGAAGGAAGAAVAGAVGVNFDPARMAELMLEVVRLALKGG